MTISQLNCHLRPSLKMGGFKAIWKAAQIDAFIEKSWKPLAQWWCAESGSSQFGMRRGFLFFFGHGTWRCRVSWCGGSKWEKSKSGQHSLWKIQFWSEQVQRYRSNLIVAKAENGNSQANNIFNIKYHRGRKHADDLKEFGSQQISKRLNRRWFYKYFEMLTHAVRPARHNNKNYYWFSTRKNQTIRISWSSNCLCGTQARSRA